MTPLSECPVCYGHGWVDGSEHWEVRVACRRCGGSGKVKPRIQGKRCRRCGLLTATPTPGEKCATTTGGRDYHDYRDVWLEAVDA